MRSLMAGGIGGLVVSLGLAACSSSGAPAGTQPGGDSGAGDASSMDAGGDVALDAPVEAANPADYLDRPMREQVSALESGLITSAGLTAAYLARIAMRDHGDGGVHAVIMTDPQATTLAAQLDGKRGKGAPLQGAVILVKDNIDTQGIATTAGSLAMAANVPAADAMPTSPMVVSVRYT